MRNLILIFVALAIVVGVLAKNPPAAAPTLAASFAPSPIKEKIAVDDSSTGSPPRAFRSEPTSFVGTPSVNIHKLGDPNKAMNAGQAVPHVVPDLPVPARLEKHVSLGSPVSYKPVSRSGPNDQVFLPGSNGLIDWTPWEPNVTPKKDIRATNGVAKTLNVVSSPSVSAIDRRPIQFRFIPAATGVTPRSMSPVPQITSQKLPDPKRNVPTAHSVTTGQLAPSESVAAWSPILMSAPQMTLPYQAPQLTAFLPALSDNIFLGEMRQALSASSYSLILIDEHRVPLGSILKETLLEDRLTREIASQLASPRPMGVIEALQHSLVFDTAVAGISGSILMAETERIEAESLVRVITSAVVSHPEVRNVIDKVPSDLVSSPDLLVDQNAEVSDQITRQALMALPEVTRIAVVPPKFSAVDIPRPVAAKLPAVSASTKFTINIEPDPGGFAKNSTPMMAESTFDIPKVDTPARPDSRAAATSSGFRLNIQDGGYCDPRFVGPTLTFAQTAELTLDDLLYQIHNRFSVNFIMGSEIGSLPVNIKAGSIPWNRLLRSQLFVSGVRATCLDGNTIQLVKNEVLPRLQDSAEVETRYIKLKFLQRTGTGTTDLAGRAQGGSAGGQSGGCTGGGGQSGITSGGSGGQTGDTAAQQSSSKFDKLIVEIEKILGIRSLTESSVSQGGQSGGGQATSLQTEERRTNRYVTQIPGRNILGVRATAEEHALIDQLIAQADRAPFQVIIKGLIYTANQDKLRDIGVQTTITEPLRSNSSDRTGGGILGHTIGAGGTLFDFSTLVGTFDFNVQATALQQNGVITVKSRPFATVLDGLCTKLNVGRSIPVVIDSTLGGQGDLQFVEALNKLEVTPHVVDDENGDPIAVTLELNLSANEVDTSVTTRGVPAVNERSIQTQLLLSQDKTAILGGFTLDSDQRSVSKTPGLGDIPILGELFKRRVRSSQLNRLYFAVSVTVIPFPETIRPVDVPGADPQPPSITPEMKQRADKAEPKQVTGP